MYVSQQPCRSRLYGKMMCVRDTLLISATSVFYLLRFVTMTEVATVFAGLPLVHLRTATVSE
jgi:hypothetical protein